MMKLFTFLYATVTAIFLGFSSTCLAANKLGDLDGDGQATILDLTRLQMHLAGGNALSPALQILADVNQDGLVTDFDVEAIGDIILGIRPLQELPPTEILSTSPRSGEGNVSLTRETIVRFTQPLSATNLVNTNMIYAEFGGRRILSRIELASDRRGVTLFYTEPLPGSARMRVTVNGNLFVSHSGAPVDADGDGVPGGLRVIEFDTASITALPGTGIIGRVFASELAPSTNGVTNSINVPLQGVTITVDGAEQALRTVTDANGYFQLMPCPAGRFFVHVDGRTVTNLGSGIRYPDMAYYPYVGKAWEAAAGYTNNLANGDGLIYLPLIRQGTLQPVSATTNTTITFPSSVIASNPALAGVSLTVPANSLFNDNGTRGGQVGIAAVSPERLPEPLPPGLNFSLVITVQTDGPGNFGQPVPIRFPNLPDPITGERLPPGAKSALWSFNHDTGKWEIVGPMTVSADGEFVECDPGVGINQPGWHGSFPGSAGGGGGGGGPPGGPPPPGGGCSSIVDCATGENWEKIHGSLIDVGFSSVKAFAAFFPISKGVKCAVSAAPAVVSFYNGAKNLYEIAKKNGSSPCTHVLAVKETTSLVNNVFDACILSKEPLNRLSALLESLKASAGLVEEFYRPDGCCPSGPGGGGGGGIGGGGGSISEQAGILKDTAEVVNILHNGLDALKDAKSALEGQLFSLFEKLVDLNCPVPKSAAAADDAEVEIDAETLSLMEETLRALEHYNSTATNFPINDLENGKKNLIPLLIRSAGATTVSFVEAHIALAGLKPDLFYKISNLETDVVLRGRLQNSPTFDGLIFAPNSPYVIDYYDPASGTIATVALLSGPSGSRIQISKALFFSVESDDTDSDGLPDSVEEIVGTNPGNPDSDGDGILDGAEVRQNTNPLDGRPVATGIIASSDTPGNAVDVCTLNDLAFVADGAAGLVVFNVAGLNPVRLAQVDTPGDARRVACAGNWAVVADGASGLAIVDVANPSTARIVRQLNLGSSAQAVVIVGGLAYVGLSSGQVVSVDIGSGMVLERLTVGGEIQDLAVEGETLYALTAGTLYALPLNEDALRVAGSVSAPGGIGGGGIKLRLFAGGGRVWTIRPTGYNIFDITNQLQPTLLRQATDGQFGWRHLAPIGSGLAIASVGPNSTADGAHDVSLYNLGPAGTNNTFVTTVPTPGSAFAVSIYNGLAYVADGQAGLQVINYLAYDTGTNPPSISLTNSFTMLDSTNGLAEEGKLVRSTAFVSDDVQVRNVEFYVDGIRQVIDGNFPFEYRFVTPLLSASKTNFTLQAKATDTGGRSTWSELITVTLVPDATPPRVIRTFPASGGIAGNLSFISATFNEPIQQSTLSTNTVRLLFAGADGVMGTGDDQWLTNGVISYRTDLDAVYVTFPTNVPAGAYQASVHPPLADLAGNPLAHETVWRFWVLGAQDTDQDGIPDSVEAAMGYNPNNPDTNGNGIWDGDEDFDGDGLKNKWELAYRIDPRDPTQTVKLDPLFANTTGNGPDGQQDFDFDGLTNLQEQQNGTNPYSEDSDGDGWDDATEIATGTGPTNPSSGPAIRVHAGTQIAYLNAILEPTLTNTVWFAASGQVAYLNAVQETPPSNTVWFADSSQVSYLNAYPEQIPTNTIWFVGSSAVSYLNALPELPPADVVWSVNSPLVSYLNSFPETLSGNLFFASPIVSYSNAPAALRISSETSFVPNQQDLNPQINTYEK